MSTPHLTALVAAPCAGTETIQRLKYLPAFIAADAPTKVSSLSCARIGMGYLRSLRHRIQLHRVLFKYGAHISYGKVFSNSMFTAFAMAPTPEHERWLLSA